MEGSYGGGGRRISRFESWFEDLWFVADGWR